MQFGTPACSPPCAKPGTTGTPAARNGSSAWSELEQLFVAWGHLGRADLVEVATRIVAKLEVGDVPPGFTRPCLNWTGRVNENGYGTLGRLYVHRVIFQVFLGDLRRGEPVDHQCLNQLCCQPEHLTRTTTGAHTRRHNALRKGTRLSHAARQNIKRGIREARFGREGVRVYHDASRRTHERETSSEAL